MTEETKSICNIPTESGYSHVRCVDLSPEPCLEDYLQAMELANWQAQQIHRDFESPQHASECHENSAIPGYVDYGLYHGATLRIDIEQGRFVFFYLPIDL